VLDRRSPRDREHYAVLRRPRSGTKRISSRAVERRADPLQHLERVPGVAGTLEPRDHRVRGLDQLGELLLRESGLGAQCIDLLCDLGVERGLGERPEACGPALEVAVGLSVCACRGGAASKACLRRRARSISIGGTADSCFEIPCEITTACRPWKKYRIWYWLRPALALSS